MTEPASSLTPAPAGKQPERGMRDRQRLERALNVMREVLAGPEGRQYLPIARRLRAELADLDAEDRELAELLGKTRAA